MANVIKKILLGLNSVLVHDSTHMAWEWLHMTVSGREKKVRITALAGKRAIFIVVRGSWAFPHIKWRYRWDQTSSVRDVKYVCSADQLHNDTAEISLWGLCHEAFHHFCLTEEHFIFPGTAPALLLHAKLTPQVLVYLLTDTCALKVIPSPLAGISARLECSTPLLSWKRDTEGMDRMGNELDWAEKNNRQRSYQCRL